VEELSILLFLQGDYGKWTDNAKKQGTSQGDASVHSYLTLCWADLTMN